MQCHIIPATAAQPTIVNRILFATHGLYNGTPFQSEEFHSFMAANGIIHHVPPYHPSSNGLAENMVKSVTVKVSLPKMLPLGFALFILNGYQQYILIKLGMVHMNLLPRMLWEEPGVGRSFK